MFLLSFSLQMIFLITSFILEKFLTRIYIPHNSSHKRRLYSRHFQYNYDHSFHVHFLFWLLIIIINIFIIDLSFWQYSLHPSWYINIMWCLHILTLYFHLKFSKKIKVKLYPIFLYCQRHMLSFKFQWNKFSSFHLFKLFIGWESILSLNWYKNWKSIKHLPECRIFFNIYIINWY